MKIFLKYHFAVVLFIYLSNVMSSQNNFEKQFSNFEDIANSINLDSEKIKKIKDLAFLKEKKLKLYQSDFERQDTTSLIFFAERKISPQEVIRQFKEDIATVINKQEFEALFKHALQPQIDRTTDKNWKNFKDNHLNIDTNNETIFYKIIAPYTADKIITNAYYNYNKAIASQKLESLRLQKNITIKNALNHWGVKKRVPQSENSKIQYFIEKAQQAGVKDSVVEKLLTALKIRDQRVAKANNDKKKFDQKHLVYFHDKNYNKVSHLFDFKRKMNELITYDQFKSMFIEQLKDRIDRTIQNEWIDLKKNHSKFSQKEEKALLEIITNHYTNRILTSEFYIFDKAIVQKKINKLNNERDLAIKNILNDRGVNIKPSKSESPKLKYFIKKAEQAGIDEPVIKKLLAALDERDRKIAEVKNYWKKFDKKFLIFYNDKEISKNAYLAEFKKEMKNLISLEQFKLMFKDQFSERVERETFTKLDEINKNYILEANQQVELKKFLKLRVLDEVSTFNYYSYNHKIAKQKLRAMQYKYDKKFQALLQSMNPKTRE